MDIIKKNCLTKFKETYQSNEMKIFTKMTPNSYTGKIRLPKHRICTFFGFERAESNTVTQLQLQLCMVFIFSCEKFEKQCVVVVVAHSCCLKKGDKMTVYLIMRYRCVRDSNTSNANLKSL